LFRSFSLSLFDLSLLSNSFDFSSFGFKI
jgi:hypothetical protein